MRFARSTPVARCIFAYMWLITVLVRSESALVRASHFDPTEHIDHNHQRLILVPDADASMSWISEEQDLSQGYEADFASNGMGKEIVGRAAQDITPLKNNVPITLNLAPGQTVYYVVENATVWGSFTSNNSPSLVPDLTDFGHLYRNHDDVQQRRLELRSDEDIELVRRQMKGQTRTVYLSANTCLQPNMNGTLTTIPPQLEMYISTSNQNPGPGQSGSEKYSFDEGYVNVTVQAASDIFVGIHAPNLTTNGGQWNFAVAASIDNWYFASNGSSSAAFLVDTDSKSALLVSANLTDPQSLQTQPDLRSQWLQMSPPFNMFIVDGISSALNGVRRSSCGLANIRLTNARIDSTITTRNSGNNPKQQFHVEGLSAGTTYFAILSYNAANQSIGSQAPVVSGGGHIWQPFSFTTKQDSNCQIIYDLPFCSDVAYAVPANPSTSQSDLTSFYDNGAQAYWSNFTNSLQQVACNTTSTSQYSLASNCTDCARDYKTWLCAVTIPRCVDFSLPLEPDASSNSPFILPRNLAATQFANGSNVDLSAVGLNASIAKKPWFAQSRVSAIDTTIKPGPYRELLPCIDLCYDMVRSCPSSLAFSCPRQRPLLLRSYGILGDADAAGITLPCNRLGVDQPRRNAGVTLPVLSAWSLCLLLFSLITFL